MVVKVTEEATDKPKTGEEGAFELPESDFEDGRLGVTVSVTAGHSTQCLLVAYKQYVKFVY